MVVPVLESRGFVNTEMEIKTSRHIDSTLDDLSQLAALRVRVHRRGDLRTGAHARGSRPDQFRLHRVRLASDRRVASVLGRIQGRMAKASMALSQKTMQLSSFFVLLIHKALTPPLAKPVKPWFLSS